MDEPFNFLDPSSQAIIKHLLKRYNEEHNATVLISSHNLNHTVDICPRIALLEHGIIIRDIDNANGSAEKELEDYFNVGVKEEELAEEEEAQPLSTTDEPEVQEVQKTRRRKHNEMPVQTITPCNTAALSKCLPYIDSSTRLSGLSSCLSKAGYRHRPQG